jgi:CheY-like chemotaxis protein
MSIALLDRLPVKKIGVMEDDSEWLDAIESALHRYGADVIVARNEEEVVELAKQGGIRLFILDVNMGADSRSQEGLDALERLKEYDPGILVGMLSGYPDYRHQAQKLRADHFEKKTEDRAGDIARSLEALLSRAGREFQAAARKLVSKGDPTGDLFDDPSLDPLADENYVALARFRKDPAWMSRHAGCYVAIVGGKLVGSGSSRAELLLTVRREHAGKRRYVTLVVDEEETEELPSPELIDEI